LADQTTREIFLGVNIDVQHVPFQDMLNTYRQVTRNEWQRRWDGVPVNKMKHIKVSLAPLKSFCRGVKKCSYVVYL